MISQYIKVIMNGNLATILLRNMKEHMYAEIYFFYMSDRFGVTAIQRISKRSTLKMKSRTSYI